MGADTFGVTWRGKTPQLAFEAATADARYTHGHGGYSGTLAEKCEFVEIPVPAGEDPTRFAQRLIDEEDDRVDDKWGPAGCVLVEESAEKGNLYYFFGWASS